MNKNFKLRFYHKTGADKGNLWKEEFFYTLEEMISRYDEVFVYKDYSLNPTAWMYDNNRWMRLSGY